MSKVRDSILDSLRAQFRARCLDITIANVERPPAHVAMHDSGIPVELEKFLRDCANNAAMGLQGDDTEAPHCPNCKHACLHCMLDTQLAIDHCTLCGVPAHASESNDDGVCAKCIGSAALAP